MPETTYNACIDLRQATPYDAEKKCLDYVQGCENNEVGKSLMLMVSNLALQDAKGYSEIMNS